ncbi:MAG: phosphoenolpyruvate--protein phosphotransferase [Parvularcula sp.]
MPTDRDTGYEPRPYSGPRALLKRMREIMAEDNSPQERLDKLVQAVALNMVADVCSIYVRRSDDTLELFATEGLKREAVHRTRLALDEGLVGWVARNRRPIKLREATTHEAFVYKPETGEDPYNAFLGVPVIRSGQVLGVLVVQNKTRRVFTIEETEVAQTVATVLGEVFSAGNVLEEQDTKTVEALLHKSEFAAGIGIVPGIVRGTAYCLLPTSSVHPTLAGSIAEEQRRLADALADMRKSVDEMVSSDVELADASREILEVFRLFAYDRGWARKLEEKVLSGLTAESAVEQTRDENRQRMRNVADPYLRQRLHDLEDLSRRLLRALSGQEGPEILPTDAVILTNMMGPADVLELRHSNARGLVLSEAATVSHAVIVARSLGLPVVAGVPEIVEKAVTGDVVLLDGASGEVHLRPPEAVVEAFAGRASLRNKVLARYAAHKDEPALTRDGTEIDLNLNAGLLMDLPGLEQTGAKGVGLFRTELQFLLGGSLPTAAEQEEHYRNVMDAAGGKPVVFRTADIGSDKRAGYMEQIHEGNPAMGWRGLRMAIDREGIMRTQIRALLAAADTRPLSVMLPLVTTAHEFGVAREIIQKEIDRHEKHVGPLPEDIRIGAMIEIPSAAWEAKRLAELSDFISIGGNDLAQFFFAADRDTDRVARRYDSLTPSFLQILERINEQVSEADTPVTYCGEQAADPLFSLALIALGMRSISVSASAVGPLKAMIGSVDLGHLAAAMGAMVKKPVETLRPQLSAYAIEQGVELG